MGTRKQTMTVISGIENSIHPIPSLNGERKKVLRYLYYRYFRLRGANNPLQLQSYITDDIISYVNSKKSKEIST
jgi:hypothetical protein